MDWVIDSLSNCLCSTDWNCCFCRLMMQLTVVSAHWYSHWVLFHQTDNWFSQWPPFQQTDILTSCCFWCLIFLSLSFLCKLIFPLTFVCRLILPVFYADWYPHTLHADWYSQWLLNIDWYSQWLFYFFRLISPSPPPSLFPWPVFLQTDIPLTGVSAADWFSYWALFLQTDIHIDQCFCRFIFPLTSVSADLYSHWLVFLQIYIPID